MHVLNAVWFKTGIIYINISILFPLSWLLSSLSQSPFPGKKLPHSYSSFMFCVCRLHIFSALAYTSVLHRKSLSPPTFYILPFLLCAQLLVIYNSAKYASLSAFVVSPQFIYFIIESVLLVRIDAIEILSTKSWKSRKQFFIICNDWFLQILF